MMLYRLWRRRTSQAATELQVTWGVGLCQKLEWIKVTNTRKFTQLVWSVCLLCFSRWREDYPHCVQDWYPCQPLWLAVSWRYPSFSSIASMPVILAVASSSSITLTCTYVTGTLWLCFFQVWLAVWTSSWVTWVYHDMLWLEHRFTPWLSR